MYWLDKLREFKSEAGMTYKDISDKTNIALTTIEKLFSGRTADPKLNMVAGIVNVLGHDVSELLGSKDTLSAYEKDMLDSIRGLDDFGKKRVADTIDSEQRRIRAEQRTPRKTFNRIFYDFPVSAGTGEFLDNSTAVIASLTNEPPRGTDYILRIAGDSMEPKFSDGDYVYVSSRTDIDVGEIGIFCAYGNVYMKVYTPDGLKSLNPKYPLMRFYENIHCLGRVIGKLDGDIEIAST